MLNEATLLNEMLAQADEAGFIPLNAFSRKLLKCTPNEINTFFDPDSRFREEYQKTVICNVRHNVTIKKSTQLAVYYEKKSPKAAFIKTTCSPLWSRH